VSIVGGEGELCSVAVFAGFVAVSRFSGLSVWGVTWGFGGDVFRVKKSVIFFVLVGLGAVIGAVFLRL
jgi:hypothetical protein